MSTLILLSAIPGSGKSTWARNYIKDHPNTKIVSSDDIREEFFGKPNDFRDEKFIWKTYLERIIKYGSEDPTCTVIADSTNLTNHYRRYYYEATPCFDKHILVAFNIPYEIAFLQNKMRSQSKIVPDSAMELLHKEWEDVSDDIKNLYDEYISITDTYINK
ncbi:MAG: ATP-binding protein [Bacilli bacterium]|nr:ATP-binding protein [Bacilli bacterium]